MDADLQAEIEYHVKTNVYKDEDLIFLWTWGYLEWAINYHDNRALAREELASRERPSDCQCVTCLMSSEPAHRDFMPYHMMDALKKIKAQPNPRLIRKVTA